MSRIKTINKYCPKCSSFRFTFRQLNNNDIVYGCHECGHIEETIKKMD